MTPNSHRDQDKGQLVCVVGPSGVGKDAVMRGVKACFPEIHLARRVVTRPVDKGNEDFDSVSETTFAQRVAAGDFLFHWTAHGLCYGIPLDILDLVVNGKTVLFNGSREALPEMCKIQPEMRVFLVTASPETLAIRLADRGRETRGQVAARLARQIGLPNMHFETIRNDGVLDDAVAAFVNCLTRPAQGE